MGATFKSKRIYIEIDDPEEGEQFLKGLIVARSNNSSVFFEELIEGVNIVLEPYRKAVREQGIDAKPQRQRVGIADS